MPAGGDSRESSRLGLDRPTIRAQVFDLRGCARPASESDDGFSCYVEDSECTGYCYAINGTLCSIGGGYDECVDANIDRNGMSASP